MSKTMNPRVALLRALKEGAEAENADATFVVPGYEGAMQLQLGSWGEGRTDAARLEMWDSYEQMIKRLYGTGLKAVNADGTTRPWLPWELTL